MATCSQSSVYLKVLTLCMIIALALLITGFATTSWSTVETKFAITGLVVPLSYLVGLWKHCVCVEVLGIKTCTCETIDSPPDWLDATRGLASLALVGMVAGCVLSFINVCLSRPSKQLKIFNLITIVGTGIAIVTAIIVYGTESKKHIDKLLKALEYITEIDVSSSTKLGYSFVLPTIAGCVCLVVCVPLFICDLNKPPKPSGVVIAPMHQDNQVQVISYPQGPSYGYPGSIQQPPTVIMQPTVYPAPTDNSLYMQQGPPAYPSAPQQAVSTPPKS